jgi:N-acetylmuramoyl-L-alanine amidase
MKTSLLRSVLKRHAQYLLLSLLFATVMTGAVWAKPVVALDAAHGGSDAGVRGASETEKDWNLKFTQALAKSFEASGFDVVTVRKGDDNLSQDKRLDTINSSGAMAVIVIHADREWTGTKQGPLIVVEPPGRNDANQSADIQRWGTQSPAQYRSSLQLARAIAQKLGVGTALSDLSDSRGLAGEAASAAGRIASLTHQSLRYLSQPSVVLIPMFLTSGSDVKRFSGSDEIKSFADKVAAGTAEFLRTP